MQLGELLVQEKAITAEQLAAGLEKQKGAPQKKLGEILVELGFIDAAKLDALIKKQG